MSCIAAGPFFLWLNMRRDQWTELDYIAGAAHSLHMSYGKYVAAGMPNLERFKRQVNTGKIRTPGQDAPPGKPRKKPGLKGVNNGKRFIAQTKCIECGADIPSEERNGPRRKFCLECAEERRRHKQRAYQQRKALIRLQNKEA